MKRPRTIEFTAYVTGHVVVEAESQDEAVEKAEQAIDRAFVVGIVGDPDLKDADIDYYVIQGYSTIEDLMVEELEEDIGD